MKVRVGEKINNEQLHLNELHLGRLDLVENNLADIHATSSPEKIVPMFQNLIVGCIIDHVLIQSETPVWSNVVKYEDSLTLTDCYYCG